MENISDAISWWENDLTSDERSEIFDKNVGKNKSWSDIGENNEKGIKKRHTWLLRMFQKYRKGGLNSSQP